MISKIAKCAMTFAGRSSVATRCFKSIPAFNFASVDKIAQVQARLVKAVERESKYEAENYETDPSVKEFLEEHEMTLIEQEGSIAMELHKTAGNFKVQIVFQSRAPQADEQPEEAEGQEQQQQPPAEGEEEQGQMQDYCDFIVYVLRADGKAVAYDCSSFDSEIQVNGVTLVDDVETHKNGNKFERISTQYNGPDFNTLDERLQTSLVEFLKTVGVNEEVAAFVEHVSLDKEQRLYMKWLKDVKSFLA